MPAPPNIPAPIPAFLPFSEISALTRAISSRISVLVWSDSWRTSSAVDASGAWFRPAVSAMGVLLRGLVVVRPERHHGRRGGEAAGEHRGRPDGPALALLLLAPLLRVAAELAQRLAGLAERGARALEGRRAGRLLALAERGAPGAGSGAGGGAQPALHLVVLHEALRQWGGATRDVRQRHVVSLVDSSGVLR